MEKLAINGGNPVISDREFQRYNSIGPEEVEAATSVLRSGVLSKFIGAWHEDFYGGPMVKEFESAWADYFGVEHAISVNSWTSGIIAGLGAIDLQPGDEVILPAWTMSACAAAILHWNCIPVFADIDPETFCINPDSVEANLSVRTRAVIAVDLFGQSADIYRLNSLAQKNGFAILSDAAQAPGALVQGRYAGTVAKVGGFSLNYHKHIHTGEGGVVVTDDPLIAERAQLLRNHAESVVSGKGITNISNMIGFNFRMGEIEAAIGIQQLHKLKEKVISRQEAAERLRVGLGGLPGLLMPSVSPGNTHVYYVFGMTLEPEFIDLSRAEIVAALRAEGVPALVDRYPTLHLLPAFQKKIAFGNQGFPWVSEFASRDVDYAKGICPVAERLNDEMFLGLLLCEYEFSSTDLDDIVTAFHKVWHSNGNNC